MKANTLPPPSFKTRVTTDPATSTTRIVFDDYQQTFNPDDDDYPAEEQAAPSWNHPTYEPVKLSTVEPIRPDAPTSGWGSAEAAGDDAFAR